MNKNRRLRPTSARPTVNFGHYDGNEQKYTQDLLVTRYLEQCVTDNKKAQRSLNISQNDMLKSPYASHINLREAKSEVFNTRQRKNLFQPNPPKIRRPISAPVYKNGNLSLNGSFSSGTISALSYVNRHKPVYKRRHQVLCVQAYVNGTHQRPVRATAPDIQQLLIECTHKLGLTSAGRKLYLGNGTLVTSPQQLSKDDEVFVSTGEPFKNPFASIQEREKLKKSSFWTLNGIMMPYDEQKKSNRMTSSSVSHRMSKLIESQKRRILVFKNGESFGGVEVVANRFEEFLDDCTKRLSLTSSARYIFDWSGKQIESFANVPSLDKCLQPSSGPVIGPLWVSKGERFSPKGAHQFLTTMIQNTKERLVVTHAYLEKLHEELNATDSCFTEDEIILEIQQEEHTLTGLQRALPSLQENLKNIQSMFKEEEQSTTPSTYKFQHISEIDASSRLLVAPGIKVRLYINGRKRDFGPVKMFLNLNELKKGTKTNEEVLQRFLDLVNQNESVIPLFGIKARRMFVKRAFLLDGRELKDINILGPDQEIWLSLGEGFIPIEIPIVTLVLDKVKLLSLWGWKQVVQKDFWIGSDQNQTHHKLWQLTQGIPPQCESQEMKVDMSNAQKIAYLNQCNTERLSENRPFLQSKQDHSLVLYPELGMVTHGQESEAEIWGKNIQQWVFSPDGTICNKHLRSLYLGVLDEEVSMLFKKDEGGEEEEEIFEGALIGLRINNNGGFVNAQFNGQFCNWKFTHDGYIQPVAFPEYVLTAVEGFTLLNNEDSQSPDLDISEEQLKSHWEIKSRNELIVTEHRSSSSASSGSDGEDKLQGGSEDYYNTNTKKKSKKKMNESPEDEDENEVKEKEVESNYNPFINVKDVYGGHKTNLVILPRFPSNHKLAATQRWGIKCVDSSQVQPSLRDKWVQQNLTWPTDERGNMLEQIHEGFLTYGVPKIKWRMLKSESANFSAAKNEMPIKLQVLRNGESDLSRAVYVIAPDVRNIKKDVQVSASTIQTNGIDTVRMTPLDIEFHQFLERCTEVLSLPFAARRVFTADGKEVLSLTSLEKNDLIYVSCGENWSDPSMSQAEHQKRLLLANLTSDVMKIKRYMALRNCVGYIIHMEADVFHQDLKLCLSSIPDDHVTTIMDGEGVDFEDNNNEFEIMNPKENDDEVPELTAHQRTHKRLEGNRDLELEAVDEGNEETLAKPNISRSVSHREALFGIDGNVQRNNNQTCMYKWVYKDEFIQLQSNPNLVIGLPETEANTNQEVVVCRKRFEDSNQRWFFSEDGTVSLVANPNLVLTVATPSLKDDAYFEEKVSNGVYEHVRLIVSNRKAVVNGNANQIFWLDEETQLFHAFATDDLNVELTAALHASICSYSVFGDTPIYQPGYYFKRTDGDKTHTFTLCEPCGRVVRGKKKLYRITDLRDFKCCMGDVKTNKIKFKGTFQCLESKVDLSSTEGETTLDLWENQLQRLRDESSVRVIASEITMTQNNPAVRLLVRRNGEGCSTHGVVVIGNMLSQILDDCTSKLNLPHAARRLYTMDGELITNMQQILKPYYPELTYLKGYQHQQGKSIFKRNDDQQGDDIETDHLEDFQIEKLDVRVPVDVWVSMGEPFAPLGDVEKTEILSKYEVSEKKEAVTSLQIQRHKLRQTKGRRMSERSPVKNAWLHRTNSEQKIESSIDILQSQLEEVKTHQKNRARSLKMKKTPSSRLVKKMESMKLYQLPRALKIKVYPNGESPERSQLIYAQTFHQLLENAANKLQLTNCARRVFTEHGVEIFQMEDVENNECYCITSGERFVAYKERKSQIDLKAAYARINRTKKNDVTFELHSPTKASPALALPPEEFDQQMNKDSVIHVENGSKGAVLSRQRPKSAKFTTFDMKSREDDFGDDDEEAEILFS